MRWVDALKVVGPMIIASVPQAKPYGPAILMGIEIADELATPGHKKKEAALDIVKLGVQITNTATKSNAIDSDQAVVIASSVIDMVVQAANELHDKSS